MNAPVKIAVVGAGLIGKRHIEAIAASGSAAMVHSIIDPDPATSAIARQLGAPYFPTLEAMVSNGAPDGVILATPNRFHLEDTLYCISKGIPVLVEKPLAVTAEEGLKIVMASEEKGIPVLVGHHRRHNPIVQKAKAEIEAGRIGKVVSVQATCWFYKPDDYFNVTWRRQTGGGPIYINLIHDIDLLQHFCGPVETVMAMQANTARSHEVEDTAVITLRFENGALGTVNLSDTIVAPWSWELTARENPAYPVTGQATYWIGGTHGSLELPAMRTWHQQHTRSWWEPIDARHVPVRSTDPIEAQIKHFSAVISGDKQPLVPARAGWQALRTIEAVKRSAESGSTVNIAI